MKLKKIFLLICVFGLLCLLGTGAWFFNQLPSPTSIKQAIHHNRNSNQATLEGAINNQVPQNADQLKIKQSALSHSHEAEDSKKEVEVFNKDEEKTKITNTILDFLEEDPTDVQVCEHLGESDILDQKYESPKKKQEDLVKKIFIDNDRGDSYVESIRHPLKKVFQDEQLAPFLREILNYNSEIHDQNEKDSFFEKMGFYSRAASISAHLFGRKKEFEETAEHSFHLSLIAKLAKKRPSLVQSGQLNTLCDEIQNGLKTNQQKNIHEERQKILQLIDRAGLKPKDLDFDPTKFSKFGLTLDKMGLNFNLSQ